MTSWASTWSTLLSRNRSAYTPPSSVFIARLDLALSSSNALPYFLSISQLSYSINNTTNIVQPWWTGTAHPFRARRLCRARRRLAQHAAEASLSLRRMLHLTIFDLRISLLNASLDGRQSWNSSLRTLRCVAVRATHGELPLNDVCFYTRESLIFRTTLLGNSQSSVQ